MYSYSTVSLHWQAYRVTEYRLFPIPTIYNSTIHMRKNSTSLCNAVTCEWRLRWRQWWLWLSTQVLVRSHSTYCTVLYWSYSFLARSWVHNASGLWHSVDNRAQMTEDDEKDRVGTKEAHPLSNAVPSRRRCTSAETAALRRASNVCTACCTSSGTNDANRSRKLDEIDVLAPVRTYSTYSNLDYKHLLILYAYRVRYRYRVEKDDPELLAPLSCILYSSTYLCL